MISLRTILPLKPRIPMTGRYKILSKTYTSLSMLSLLMGSNVGLAQGLGSHVHGSAELNVVMVGQRLQLEFISPAMNLLGIERAPRSEAEVALLERVNADLQSSEWLIGDALVNCQMSLEAFDSPQFTAAHEHDEEHEHDGEHEHHDHAHESEAHGDFRVQYLFDCPASPAKEIHITAFTRFSAIQEINVQWVTETQQGLARLSSNDTRLTLE
ncbi:MAG: hypothetical protein DHS20C12_15010 [Pseudohongiella sp.]|nr:MAG: hypothetical protein DHS20C12_15010 [Pseudohongiella sp.]